jgi:RNA polymerase primary sigma factor
MSARPDQLDTSQGLGVLARQAARHPLLSQSDEIRLAKRIEFGDAHAKQRMVECNVRLVLAVARPYSGRGVPFPDLVQEGIVGLVRAVERFDHRRGVKFSTYAVFWIRRSILDAIGGQWMIRIPAHARRQIAAVRIAENDLRRAGSTPSEEAISERTGLSLGSVHALRDVARVTVSLDEVIGDQAETVGERLADPNGGDALERVGERDQRADLWAMLELLPERHREVLMRRYGLGRASAQTHQQIGEWLGLSEERSRQLEREALRRLREVAAHVRRAA